VSTLLYYIALPLIYLVSLLPFRLLYILSDVVFLVLYHLIGYRKKVVLTNLRNSFPDKSEAEIHTISIEFYHNFCDLMLETIKTLTISPSALRKHVLLEDDSVFRELHKKGQSAIIVMGHLGNWELGGARFAIEPFHKLYVIYHPLVDKNFERLIVQMRTRLGNGLYKMKETMRGMITNREQLTLTAFIADQTPSPKGAYWTTFLNQDTPVFTGTEKIARKFNYPVVYCSTTRVKRGLYAINSEVLVGNPQNTVDNEISELHTKRLEKDIFAQPASWLWSHRRWKHTRNIQNH